MSNIALLYRSIQKSNIFYIDTWTIPGPRPLIVGALFVVEFWFVAGPAYAFMTVGAGPRELLTHRTMTAV